MREIPCAPAGVSRWTQRTALGGRDYLLTFDWNQRAGGWYLTLADQDGSAIVSGRRLSTGYSLLSGCLDARLPPGDVVLVDTQAGDAREPEDPSFATLGARHVLAYLDADDLAGIA